MSGYDLALDEARRERDLLARALADAEEDLADLERLVAKRRARTHLTTGADASTSGTSREVTSPASSPRSQTAPAATPNSLIGLVRAVFDERPGRILSVEEIYNALIERGWNTTSNDWRAYLTSKLSGMVGEGRLARAGRGIYSLPTADEALLDGDDSGTDDADDQTEETRDEPERLTA